MAMWAARQPLRRLCGRERVCGRVAHTPARLGGNEPARPADPAQNRSPCTGVLSSATDVDRCRSTDWVAMEGASIRWAGALWNRERQHRETVEDLCRVAGLRCNKEVSVSLGRADYFIRPTGPDAEADRLCIGMGGGSQRNRWHLWSGIRSKSDGTVRPSTCRAPPIIPP